MTAITMRKSVFTIVCGLMVLILGITGVMLHRAEASTAVPAGAEVNSATLYVYITSIEPATDDEVFVHEVTSSWDEIGATGVTWDTRPSYNPTAEDSFQTGTTAGVWRSADVTDVVQSWVDGGDNYGLLMREVCPDTVRDTTLYASSEYATVALRPYLEIDFASIPDVTIQRSGATHEDVFDTYVWFSMPTANHGNENQLYTGTIPGGNPSVFGCKFSLIQFDIEPVVTPDCRWTGGGTINDGATAPAAVAGVRVTHGFELHCDPSSLPNNLEVNWGGNHFHLLDLLTAECYLDEALDPRGPNPPRGCVNTIEGTGTGRYNGVDGYKISFKFTDQGEPGKVDQAEIVIKNASETETVLEVSGNLQKGNQQVHCRSCPAK